MSKSKKAGAVATTSVLLIGTGVAVAYWTGSGAGTGSASTASPTQAIRVVQQPAFVGDLGPGITEVPLTGVFDNLDSSEASVFVKTVTATIQSVTKAPGAPAGACGADDYQITDPVMQVDANIPAGNAVGEWGGATIKFKDKTGVNQDGCKGATVTIAYTVA